MYFGSFHCSCSVFHDHITLSAQILGTDGSEPVMVLYIDILNVYLQTAPWPLREMDAKVKKWMKNIASLVHVLTPGVMLHWDWVASLLAMWRRTYHSPVPTFTDELDQQLAILAIIYTH